MLNLNLTNKLDFKTTIFDHNPTSRLELTKTIFDLNLISKLRLQKNQTKNKNFFDYLILVSNLTGRLRSQKNYI